VEGKGIGMEPHQRLEKSASDTKALLRGFRVGVRTRNRPIRGGSPRIHAGEERLCAPGKSRDFDQALERWQCQGLVCVRTKEKAKAGPFTALPRISC